MKPDTDMLARAQRHLSRKCPHMRRVIKVIGPCKMTLERDRFKMLVRSITSQQISVHAARAVQGRLVAAAAPGKLDAPTILRMGEEQLRAAGCSGQKARYMLSLAERVESGETNLRLIGRKSDEEIIATLTKIKGIGVWTAQMFLMFSLGRPDVFPCDDLGIRQAIRRFRQLDELPTKQQSLELAEVWRPYSTVASWYCWRSLDLPLGVESK
jgi:DNA-3-methyladenine glycosylase II